MFTNHSIRTTMITLLDENDFAYRHIIRATGRKDEITIKNYSRRLPEAKKSEISDALNTASGQQQTENKSIYSKRSTNTDVVIFLLSDSEIRNTSVSSNKIEEDN